MILLHSVPPSRVDRAVSRVYRLALQDFNNSRLVSSCAAFIEMLDRDSRLLRVDVQAAVRIARYAGEPAPRDSDRTRMNIVIQCSNRDVLK